MIPRLALVLLGLLVATAAGAQVLPGRAPGFRSGFSFVSLGVPTPAQTFSLGVYPYDADGQPYDMANREGWLGAPYDFILKFIAGGTWADLRNSVSASPPPKPMLYAVGLTVPGTSLAQVAAGSNDADFTFVAQTIVTAQPSGDILVRLGHEQNNWPQYAWQSHGVEGDYIAANRRVVGLFRAVSSRFKFIFSPTLVNAGNVDDWTLSYPGDDYVDIIGPDVYFDAQFDLSGGQSATEAFNYKKTAAGGLDAARDFALAHGKGFGLSEFGFQTTVAEKPDPWADAVSALAAYLQTNNAVVAAFWDSNAGHKSQFSKGAQPTAGAAYRAAFGAPAFVTAPSVTAYTGEAISIPLTYTQQGVTSVITGTPGPFTVAGGALTAPAQASPGAYSVPVRGANTRALTANQTFSISVQAVANQTVPAGNILSNPQALDNASWTKSGVTVSANAITGPDGAQTADLVRETATGGSFRRVVRSTAITAGTKYRVVAWVKRYDTANVGQFNLAIDQCRATYDLTSNLVVRAGNASGHPTALSSAMAYLGQGWWQAEVICQAVTSKTAEFKFDFNRVQSTSTDSPFYAGDGTSGVYVGAIYAVTVP